MTGLRPLVNDPDISDEDFLLRVVRPDTIDPGPPITARSNAFQQRSAEGAAEYGLAGPCQSVALRSIWLEQSGKVADLLAKFDPSYGIVVLSVHDVRNLTRLSGEPQPQGVMLDPTDEPWHSVMWDLSGAPRSRPAQKALSEAVVEWLYVPPQVQ